MGEAAAAFGTRAFLITGAGLAEDEDLTERVCCELLTREVDFTTFPLTDVGPDIAVVDSAAESCAEARCDCLIGLGQAGVIDTAKLVSVVRGHDVDSIRPFVVGERGVEAKGPPLVAVPTVAVTGAEITSTALVTDPANGVRWSLSHPYLAPDNVVMDTELTLSAPPELTAAAGIGAFAFALEAFVSSRSNELTDMFALEAVRLIGQNLLCAVRDGTNMEARTAMCLAAYLAGAAATGARPGVANMIAPALQMALGTHYGEAVAMLLPASIEFNRDHAKDKYATVVDLLAANVRPGARGLLELLAALYEDIGLTDAIARLKMDYGIIEETLNSVAKSEARASANPRPVDRAGLVRILRHTREHIQRRSASR